MADKLRRTFPLKVTFSDGEQPTGQKLTAISEQTRNGLVIIEKAIGDPWNQSGDSVFTSHPLYIPNLARFVGANNFLNPALYPLQTEFDFQEAIGQKNPGKNEGHLLLKPKAGTSPVGAGTSLSASPVANERDLNTSGDATAWWVDLATGRFRTRTPLSSNATVTYTIDPPDEWVVGQETVPGVIPDPRQTTTYSSCRIENSAGTWLLHLPPRQPLDAMSETRERPASYPASQDEALSFNKATATGAPNKYWQDDATDALADAYYRYALPKEIQDAGLSASTELPQGTLYLYNTATKTIIEDVVFKIPLSGNTGYTLEVTSATFDFDTVDSATNDSAGFNSGLILITCGTPLAKSMWTMWNAFLKHEHKNDGTLDTSVSHDELDMVNPPTDSYTSDSHDTRYPTYLPAWHPSNWVGDAHTSLLSRAGSQGTGDARSRDRYDNAMLGDLIMANADEVSGLFLEQENLSGSYKIYFGEVGGPYIQGVSDNDITVSQNIQWQEELLGPDGGADPWFIVV